MPAQPVIGITCNFRTQTGEDRADSVYQYKNYADAIVNAGGTPLLLPLAGDIPTIADTIDGWLIPGGADINPAEYGCVLTHDELTQKRVSLVNPERYAFEKQLYFEFKRRHKPMLGICLGCQLIAVFEGSQLYTDIVTEKPDCINHEYKSDQPPTRHRVNLEKDSRLSDKLHLDEFEVASSHHQAISALGSKLKAIAFAPDGIIEAVELEATAMIIGVQWHPERQIGEPASDQLFRAFVHQASLVGKAI